MKNPHPKFLDRCPPTVQAGILCADPQFQSFAAQNCGLAGQHFNRSAAAEYLRRVCQINTRAALNTSAAAQSHLAALRTSFDAWRGHAPQPR